MNIEEILKKHVDEEGNFNHGAAAQELKEEQAKAYVPKSDFNTKNKDLKTLETTLETLQAEAKDLEALKSENEKYRLKDLKTTTAIQAGLPLELANRLSGETEEEILADAEKLSAFVAQKPTLPLGSTEPVEVDKEEQAYANMIEDLN